MSTLNVAEMQLIERFGIDQEMMDWIKDMAVQTVEEFQNRGAPPIVAVITLALTQHLAGEAAGMELRDVVSVTSENRQLLHDIARWMVDDALKGDQQKPDGVIQTIV